MKLSNPVNVLLAPSAAMPVRPDPSPTNDVALTVPGRKVEVCDDPMRMIFDSPAVPVLPM